MQLGLASTVARMLVVWQTAQWSATRGKPMIFFVKPIGSPFPSSHDTPSAA